MRSRQEIAFRLKQEFCNLSLWIRTPSIPEIPALPQLPDPAPIVDLLHGSGFESQVILLAEEILAHHIPAFGGLIETGPGIHWRRDYAHNVETGLQYFRRIPYLDFHRAGDHKYIWELNRHQHLVTLAQAFLFTRRSEFLDEAVRQVESWIAANPFMRGINWTSALEVAFRALSWIWLDRLAGAHFTSDFRRPFLQSLYLHGRYLENNLSIYFSPNTHLLGEAVALHALGILYPAFPESSRWRDVGSDIVEQQMLSQVRTDGSHFEQSTYYHVYALDFFLFHELVGKPPESYREKLWRMAQYLDALMGSARRIPLIGDDDGGRLFHPYGDRDAFGRATLATCGILFSRPEWICTLEDVAEQAAWWTGGWTRPDVDRPRTVAPSRLFPDAGVALMAAGDVHIVIKAGPFAPGSGGHSHSDVLSFVCRRGNEEILIDSGTYTYLSDPVWRERFRGTAGHNTIRIDGRDQATPAGPFRWHDPPETKIRAWKTAPDCDFLDASCRYGGLTHRRQFYFRKPDLLVILDFVDGPPGTHNLEQFWHPGSSAIRPMLTTPAEEIEGWRSRGFGRKEPAPVLVSSMNGPLPVSTAATISFGEQPDSLEISGDGRTVTVRFPNGTVFPVVFEP